MNRDLDAELLDAHAREDNRALVGLYRDAADLAEARGDIDAACFFLTHAYVFGLETAHKDAGTLHRRLCAYGRER